MNQDKVLKELEEHVIEVKDNVNKADNEIEDADKLDKKSNKKTMWIIIIIIFIVAAVVAILVTMIIK